LATGVDTAEEAGAAVEVVALAELHGHGTASCFVGHWFYHGEAGLAQSDLEALRWYERAAGAGDASGRAARDKVYLDGKGCGPDASAESHGRAVNRLRAIATPQSASGRRGEPTSSAGLGDDDAARAFATEGAVGESGAAVEAGSVMPAVVVQAAQQRLLGGATTTPSTTRAVARRAATASLRRRRRRAGLRQLRARQWRAQLRAAA
jgi:hypothetical protein